MPLRTNAQHHTELFLELFPGQSCFLLTSGEANKKTEPLAESRKYPLSGGWTFKFQEGHPKVDNLMIMRTLTSWSALSDSASYFYGTGLYTQHFLLPDSILKYKDLMIDLGKVHEVATVTLNGKDLGTSWSIPYRLKIPANLLKKNNTIEIRVNNLSANYMRLYDQLHPEWKKFYDINIVDIQYKPYDGSKSTAMPSGLTGQVSILYR